MVNLIKKRDEHKNTNFSKGFRFENFGVSKFAISALTATSLIPRILGAYFPFKLFTAAADKGGVSGASTLTAAAPLTARPRRFPKAGEHERDRAAVRERFFGGGFSAAPLTLRRGRFFGAVCDINGVSFIF